MDRTPCAGTAPSVGERFRGTRPLGTSRLGKNHCESLSACVQIKIAQKVAMPCRTLRVTPRRRSLCRTLEDSSVPSDLRL